MIQTQIKTHEKTLLDKNFFSDEPILRVENLKIKFSSLNGSIHAVRGVDLVLKAGESVAIVGESGSGKSVLSRSLLGLIDAPPRTNQRGHLLIGEKAS